MKNKIKYIVVNSFILCLLAIMFPACDSDLGNYNYRDINELSFKNFDTINGYNVFTGDSLKLSPDLISSKGQEDNYSYEWSIHIPTSFVGYDSIISTEKNLKTKIRLNPGNYFLQYKVTDNQTNVLFHIRTNLLVSTPVYEGYMVLNDVDGKSRLDMLSYDNSAETFEQYTDVLQELESSLPEQGTPYQVLCMYASRFKETYGIYLLTDSGTNRLEGETFGWDPINNIRYQMLGDVPTDFKADHMTGTALYNNSYPMFFLYTNGNFYCNQDPLNSSFIRYISINNYGNINDPFTASPYIVTTGNNTVMYDVDNRNFATIGFNKSSAAEVSVSLNYPTGYDLLYMEQSYSGSVYAILQHPSTLKNYLLRFVIGQEQTYFEEITGTAFENASHYAVSPDLGYLFYSVDGKVYEYDLSLKTSKLMIDKGGDEITYLSFQNFFNRTGNANYENWAKWLTVGSYNGTEGTLEQYSIPPVNGQIIQTNQWTGFGKIISVSYRERG
ncbi:PKD-like family lipoprotein [Flavivirga sp. 57AJ16]|uniref:PKD-like family lipoprotein n=1 Tax=Flavivirga sp. 57AJ16 TaxID=3025307 RepID=UPI002366D0A8|nr:PKD-like family lipoprotein [Flavivirga sp. 57AJ16]MDD7885093.1 PKD-like family lipoprotein [Flavivirga sp. 57AJ16]